MRTYIPVQSSVFAAEKPLIPVSDAEHHRNTHTQIFPLSSVTCNINIFDRIAAREGIVPVVMAESNLFSLVRSLVKEELGLAFLLKMAVAKDPECLRMRRRAR